MKTEIKLSDHFNFGRLLRFVFPSVIMMIFTSVYGVVDGLFVSNVVGKTAFTAVNLIMPVPMGLSALGFMIGTGGSALVAKFLGEGQREKANALFSFLVYVTVGVGALISLVGFFALPTIAAAMGATGERLEYCIVYGRILMLAMVPFMLQNVFQSFFVTAEKPRLGLIFTVAAGVTNIVLDGLFVWGLSGGVVGAAWATAFSQLVGGILPIFYFIRKNSSLLRLGKTGFQGKELLQTCFNGSSELMTNLSLSIVNIAYNAQLMRFAPENGVAAYGTIMYVNFIFLSAFIGYSIGVAPIVGYNYGAGRKRELRNVLKRSLILIAVVGGLLTIVAMSLASPLSSLFVGYDSELLSLTKHAFIVYSFSFLVIGFNIFGSSFFTGLNNGFISAVISFLRTLLFQLVCIFSLPLLFGIEGVWLSIIVAETLGLIVTFGCILGMRKRYGY